MNREEFEDKIEAYANAHYEYLRADTPTFTREWLGKRERYKEELLKWFDEQQKWIKHLEGEETFRMDL